MINKDEIAKLDLDVQLDTINKLIAQKTSERKKIAFSNYNYFLLCAKNELDHHIKNLIRDEKELKWQKPTISEIIDTEFGDYYG